MRDAPDGRYLIVTAVLVVTCLLLLTANIAGTELGGNGGGLGAVEQLQGIVFPLALGLWTVLLIWFLIRGRKKGRGGPRRAREEQGASVWGIVVVFVIIGVVSLISGPMKNTIFNSEDSGLNDSMNQPLPSGGQAIESSQMIMIGALAGVLIAMLPLLYRYAKGRSISGEGSGNLPEDVQTLETSIDRVRMSTGDELRDAVISSYQQVLEVARGRMKDADMLTPREIKIASVETLRWPEPEMNDLTILFELARYSDHQIDEGERSRSLECLEAILQKAKGA